VIEAVLADNQGPRARSSSSWNIVTICATKPWRGGWGPGVAVARSSRWASSNKKVPGLWSEFEPSLLHASA
jgi:hypothetical protein